MGNFSTGDKPKFDLITASKTKKYKIITAVVLILGVLFLLGGLLLRSFITSTDIPNSLTISNLSNLTGKGPIDYKCTIPNNQPFILNTGTLDGHPLTEPIVFTLEDGAEDFLEVWNSNETKRITRSYYSGLFYLHIKADAPKSVPNNNGDMVSPTGTLKISCGSFVIKILFTYAAI